MSAPKPCLLIIDDEADLITSAKLVLKKDFKILEALEGKSALEKIKAHTVDIILLDINLPDISGLELFPKIKAVLPNTEIIILTALADTKIAVNAIQMGAYDFITKPYDTDNLLITCLNAAEKKDLLNKTKLLQEEVNISKFHQLVGQSPEMKKVFEIIKKVANTSSTVLITGETGTGKELVARAIHNQGNRKNKPFIAINCGGIPSELLESELFGHEAGSFTSAQFTRIGKFELANGGTIFLDEIGNMPYTMQAKLLRVLQEKEIERVGSNTPLAIDVRIVSATNIDIQKEIEKGKFRSDLLHRLNVIPLQLPSLTKRKKDIAMLANYFLEKFKKQYNHSFTSISKEVLKIFQAYPWPGNVRELEHLLERIVTLEEGTEIKKINLPIEMNISTLSTTLKKREKLNLRKSVEEFERQIIIKAFHQTNFNKSKAAHLLGVNRTTMLGKLNTLNINFETIVKE